MITPCACTMGKTNFMQKHVRLALKDFHFAVLRSSVRCSPHSTVTTTVQYLLEEATEETARLDKENQHLRTALQYTEEERNTAIFNF